MANTRTAYRWNLNGWYFKSIEVAEDPDFPESTIFLHAVRGQSHQQTQKRSGRL